MLVTLTYALFLPDLLLPAGLEYPDYNGNNFISSIQQLKSIFNSYKSINITSQLQGFGDWLSKKIINRNYR